MFLVLIFLVHVGGWVTFEGTKRQKGLYSAVIALTRYILVLCILYYSFLSISLPSGNIPISNMSFSVWKPCLFVFKMMNNFPDK